MPLTDRLVISNASTHAGGFRVQPGPLVQSWLVKPARSRRGIFICGGLFSRQAALANSRHW